MNAVAWLALLAPGCAPAAAVDAPPAVEAAPAADLDPLVVLATTDVRGAAEVSALLLDRIQRAGGAPEAARRLAVNCPYTRSTYQLPLALKLTADRVDLAALDPLVQDDWRRLKRGLADHVAALDALGADLPLPQPGDFLDGRLPFGAYVTRADLEASADPIHDTLPLLDAIGPIVEAYDAPTLALLDETYPHVQAAVGTDRMFFALFAGWHAALRRLQPFVHGAAEAREVNEMINALDRLVGQAC